MICVKLNLPSLFTGGSSNIDGGGAIAAPESKIYLTLRILGKIFSRRILKYLFLFFPENRMTFHANCLHLKCQILFSGKVRKIF